MLTPLIGLACASLLGGGDAGEADPTKAPVVAIKASTIVVGDGVVYTDGVLILDGDTIRDVGIGLDVPRGATVIEHDGFVTAGMVAPHSTLLPSNERQDTTDPFLESAELRYGFDDDADACEDAVEHGVTAAALTPTKSAPVGGLTAVVKTHGGTVLAPRAHLAISMDSAAAQSSRFPTSYSGLVQALRERFGEEASGPYLEAKSGQLPVLIAADDPDEAQRAIRFARDHGLGGALLGARRVGEQLEALRASGLGVVFNVFNAGLTDRSVDAMLAVAGSDVEFAFALTDPSLLRFSAATLVRAGADPGRVWTALTAGGARIAGVGDRVGVLRRGYQADLCFWSGHPLELSSRLESVVIGGELVHTAEAPEEGDDQ